MIDLILDDCMNVMKNYDDNHYIGVYERKV